jgi:Protein of unknown function (DUF3592)
VTPDRRTLWMWRASLAAGVVFIIVGAVLLVFTVRFVADAERATGTVVDLDRRRSSSDGALLFYPVVRFTTANGEAIEFVDSTGSRPPLETPGDRVEVLYDPDDPNDAELSGIFHVWLVPAGLLVLGSAFLGTTWFAGPRAARRRRRPGKADNADVDWLRAHGHRVKGGSPRAVPDDSLAILGRSPFLVEVDVHDPVRNEVRVLTSASLWFDPAPYLKDREALDVYIDPQRPERYFIDLSFLPPYKTSFLPPSKT